MQTLTMRAIAIATAIATGLVAGLLAPGSVAQAEERIVRLGVPPWQGAQIKSAVVTELLERLGWTVEWTEAAAPLIFQELANGRLDANLSAWVPGQDTAFQPLVDAGRIAVLGENLDGALTGLATPAATAPGSLTTLTHIDRFRDAFDGRLYCIEPGSGGHTVAKAAIDQDLYGLGDWTLVSSSTQGMLAQVGRAIKRGEPMLFCGWSPHWMNVAFELRYLDDPKQHWGGRPGGTRVLTLARTGLAEDAPDLATLLSRIRVDALVQSEWIHQYARLERDRDAVAREWLDNNSELVSTWLDGLKGADGNPAITRIFAAEDH